MGELLASPRPDVTAETAADVAARVFAVDGDAVPLPGERDANFRLDTREGALYLKIANRLDDVAVVEMQALAMEHVACVNPGLPVPRVVRAGTGAPVGRAELDGGVHGLLLTGFLAGSPPEVGGATAAFWVSLGGLAGRLDRALSSFFHPRGGRPLLWDVSQLGELRAQAAHVRPARRELVGRWLGLFDEEVAPALGRLRAQPIHGDLHQANLLVDAQAPDRVTGIVDFGDLVHAPLVLDPAVSAAYQCFRQDDLESAVAELVGAYHRANRLDADERRLLPSLIGCRLTQSVIVAAWRATIDPENADYIGADEEDSWEALETLSALDLGQFAGRLEEACLVGSMPAARARDPVASLESRRRRLGPALSLSYDVPVRPVRGDGVWLVDVDGTRYLDAYNNVPHVGHSRREVVDAVTRQLRLLTTNTRYLVDTVTDYADRLVALLPPGLEIVMFVNSGSEANDLAYQIASVVTGNRGVIVTEHAYHGCTSATTAMSPEEFGLGRLEPWAATIPAPGASPLPTASLELAVAALDAAGHGPAMVIADTVFSSDGIHPPPTGWLGEACRVVRSAGGLYVADEVQAGFGRVGSSFWGFARDVVVPDIVTLGKPMGNGYPMGAVVTTREIAESFAARWHFFSTFAGSPVAAAAGGALLDVLERDDLVARAESVGATLRERLAGIDTPLVADVRGAGLFVGVEIADHNGAPAPGSAAAVVEEMRRRRVLIGRTGPRGNVLKIRPPLVFGEQHVETLVETLAESLDRGMDELPVGQ